MSETNLVEAIGRAIHIERDGARFYRALSTLSADNDTRFLLLGMATEEEEHAKVLDDLKQGKIAVLPNTPMRMAPESGSADDEPAGSFVQPPEEPLTLEEAVEMALEAENDAAFTYLALARQSEGPVADLFIRLAHTEEQHARVLAALQRRLEAEEG